MQWRNESWVFLEDALRAVAPCIIVPDRRRPVAIPCDESLGRHKAEFLSPFPLSRFCLFGWPVNYQVYFILTTALQGMHESESSSSSLFYFSIARRTR